MIKGKITSNATFIVLLLIVSLAAVSAAAVTDAGASFENRPGWRIPVLCYHTFYHESSTRNPGPLDATYEAFEDVLHYLQKNGFRTIIPETRPLRHEPNPLTVVITFDDGHVSQMRAAELLEAYGMRGIFFIIPSLVDVPDYPHLSSSQLADLADRGHLIGVHGHRHVSMPRSAEEIIAVLDTVPDLLMEIPGISERDIHSLAYPYGHFTPAVVRSMRSRYPLQYTVNPGYWDGRSTLVPRILLTRSKDKQFYLDYLSGVLNGRRALKMREPNGSRRSVVRFDNPGNLDPSGLHIRSVSPDRFGRFYQEHPAASYFTKGDGYLVFNIADYLEDHHPPENRALSFAVTRKEGDVFRFVSDGYLIWVPLRSNVHTAP